MTADTSEKGLESLICAALTGQPSDTGRYGAGGRRARVGVSGRAGYGPGWISGDPHDYDREHCVDLVLLSAFLRETQPDVAESLNLYQDNPTRQKFLARLQGGGCQARRHRRAAQRGQPRPVSGRPALRDAVAGEREGQCPLGGRTASASRVSFGTAATTRNWRWICACSSTACRSPLSSSRTASPSKRWKTAVEQYKA